MFKFERLSVVLIVISLQLFLFNNKKAIIFLLSGGYHKKHISVLYFPIYSGNGSKGNRDHVEHIVMSHIHIARP